MSRQVRLVLEDVPGWRWMFLVGDYVFVALYDGQNRGEPHFLVTVGTFSEQIMSVPTYMYV
jgi:hypothetical protein